MRQDKGMPLPVSVQICTLNEESNIRDCLIAVDANNPEEIIVIDGGSTDRTVEIASDMGARVLQPGKLGLGPSRQMGWSSTKCPYVAFVDADDYLPSTWLEDMLKQLVDGEYEALQSMVRAQLDGSWIASGWDQYFRTSIRPATATNMVGRPALFVVKSLRAVDISLPSLDEDTHLSRFFEQLGFRQGVGSAIAFRKVERSLGANLRKWRSYGRGYRGFVVRHPERRAAVIKHMIWTIPVQRSWPPVLQGYLRQPLFGFLMAFWIGVGWLEARRRKPCR